MVGLGGNFQHFQLDIGTQRRKEMVTLRGLRGHCLGGRFGQRRILLERFMIRFHVPSFAIACGDPIVSEFEITGDQMEPT
jgi:hypothetical protein